MKIYWSNAEGTLPLVYRYWCQLIFGEIKLSETNGVHNFTWFSTFHIEETHLIFGGGNNHGKAAADALLKEDSGCSSPSSFDWEGVSEPLLGATAFSPAVLHMRALGRLLWEHRRLG